LCFAVSCSQILGFDRGHDLLDLAVETRAQGIDFRLGVLYRRIGRLELRGQFDVGAFFLGNCDFSAWIRVLLATAGSES
jgi:hypothetical protein